MWYPLQDYTLKQARDFLRKDFLKIVKRTKYLYVERKPKKAIGYGFFEPILLFFCWCDFLGALYCGDAKRKEEGGIGSTKRAENYIKDILGNINKRYKEVARDLIKIYRHGTVHAYAPAGPFEIKLSEDEEHLLKRDDGRIVISISTLLDDMIKGVKLFAERLHLNSKVLSHGSLVAFNKARKELG